MSFNTFGKIFRFTTWGESHGPAIGCVVDGCPPNIPLSEKDIQTDMDRRRPGQSKFTTQRKEPDKAIILSGFLKVKQLEHLFQLLFIMKIKNLETMSLLKINLDQVMLILPILKNMGLEILEVVVDNQQERRLAEWQLAQLLELF
jgi:hypothetical protein